MTIRVKVPLEFREEQLNVARVLKKKFPCDRNHLLNRIPIAKWLPSYSLSSLSFDFIAGLTVALTAIPQGIAYAVIAGLPPQYGLYAEVMPGLVYMLLGSCNYITIGPTAIMALMIQKYVKLSPDFAVLCAFLSGIAIFILGVLNLGFLVDFVSMPVIVGFTTAAALTISSSQIKSLLGLPGSGHEFIDTWESIVKNIGSLTVGDSLLGITTIVILISLKKIGTFRKWATFNKYLALSRNAIVVILGTFTAFMISRSHEEIPFAITGNVASGFPKLALPPFSTQINGTDVPLSGMLKELGGSLFTIPFVAILEVFAIAKAFAKGKPVDASQEMVALGVCSLSGSFLGGMPVTGSFTRTALNNACNVKTPLGGLFTVLFVLSALGLLTQTFYFIPKAVLAGVIIMAVLSMIEYDLIYQIWRTKRLDIVPLLVTFFACLIFGVDYGIIVGIIMNLLFILQKTARPSIKCDIVKMDNRFLLVVTPDQSLYFSSTEHLRNKITKSIHTNDLVEFVVIDGHYIHHLDATVAAGIQSLIKDLAYVEKKVILWNWNKEPTGVMYRINSDFEKIFKKSDSIESLLPLLPPITRSI